jgi:hypothetical protein
MRYAAFLVLALAGCASPANAPAPEKGALQLTIPAARVAECEAAGGCAFISKAEVVVLMQQAYQMGSDQTAHELASRLDSHGCMKDSI